MKRRKALLVVAGVLLLFGIVAIGALYYSWTHTPGNPAPTLTGWMFLIAGAGFLIGGGAMLIYNISKYQSQQWLVDHGTPYRAKVLAVTRDVKSQFTGTTSYHVTATGQHGSDTRDFFQTFRSVTPFFDKDDIVWVYVDPDNSENFFIDDSIVKN